MQDTVYHIRLSILSSCCLHCHGISGTVVALVIDFDRASSIAVVGAAHVAVAVAIIARHTKTQPSSRHLCYSYCC